jgi:uncharacterized protein YneF (UPF0154 family)
MLASRLVIAMILIFSIVNVFQIRIQKCNIKENPPIKRAYAETAKFYE